MGSDYEPKNKNNKKHQNKNYDECEYDECELHDINNITINDFDEYDFENIYDEYNFDDKYEEYDSDSDYEDSTAKFKKKINSIRSFFKMLDINWKPLFFLEKIKEEKRQKDAEEASNKAFSDKIRNAKLVLAAEEARLDAIMALIPIESKMYRENRLMKEKNERIRLKEEADERARKADEERTIKNRQKNSSLGWASLRYIGGGQKLNSQSKIDPKILEAQRVEQAKKKNEEKKARKEEEKKLDELKRKFEEGTYDPIKPDETVREKFIREQAIKEAKREKMIKDTEKTRINEPYTVEIEGLNTELDEDDEDAIQVAIRIVKSWSNDSNKHDYIFEHNVKKINQEKAKEAKAIMIEDDAKHWVTVTTKIKIDSEKKFPFVLKMGAASFRSEQNKDIDHKNHYKLSLEKLKDKDIKLLCSSIVKKVKCKHGNLCRFAHSIDDFIPSECFFGDNCKFMNNNEKKCIHIHPNENKITYCKRVGVNFDIIKPIIIKDIQPIITKSSSTIWNKPPNIQKTEDISELTDNTNDQRTVALEKLKSAKNTSTKASRLCSSTANNQKCKYGNNCRFAHSIEELSPSECFFGDNCQLMHSNDKKCLHLHPIENKMEYCQRIGLKNDIVIGKNICRSVRTGKPCEHGSNCRFTH